jgi:hypothetical protein
VRHYVEHIDALQLSELLTLMRHHGVRRLRSGGLELEMLPERRVVEQPAPIVQVEEVIEPSMDEMLRDLGVSSAQKRTAGQES